jgi:hypothetical protein
MPEIRYRKRLNEAFGPGGWGMAPRGESHITDRQVSREWGLVCLGRYVSPDGPLTQDSPPDHMQTRVGHARRVGLL